MNPTSLAKLFYSERKYPRRFFIALSAILSIVLSAATTQTSSDLSDRILNTLSDEFLVSATAATKQEQKGIIAFYQNREHKAAWISESNLVSLDAKFLLETLRASTNVGLDPNNYFISSIENRMLSYDAKQLAELDIMLTMAYVRYATHLTLGSAHGLIEVDNQLNDKENFDGFDFLEKAIANFSLFPSLYKQEPSHEQYTRLKAKLHQYRDLSNNGSWSLLPTEHLLKPGIRDTRVIALKQRLKFTGDLPLDDLETNHFDKNLKQALMNFQERHNFLADGIAGKETLVALNVSVDDRIRQIILNMERWRQMPADLGDDYILVNTAGFKLTGIKKGREKLSMRVVVGQDEWATPTISSTLTQLLINPDWRVPHSIATQELLPIIKRNPNYLTNNGYEIIANRNGETVRLDPNSIDWSKMNRGRFPFQLRKVPGTSNPLGKVKFFIPNKHNVYLHDTNRRDVFKSAYRNLSHGCIRLERPKDLIKFVLSSDSKWDNAKINEAYNSTESQIVNVADRLPVYLGYFTAWVGDDGKIGFYNDIYMKDKAIITAANI